MQRFITRIKYCCWLLFLPLLGQAQNADYTVHFRSGTALLEANAKELTNKSQLKSTEIYGNYFYRFIQFYEMPTAATHQKLAKKGIVLLEYIPNKVYVAAIPTRTNFKSWSALGIRSLSEITTTQKRGKRLPKDNFPAWAMEGDFINLSIRYYSPISAKQIESELNKIEASITSKLHHVQLLNIQIKPNRIDELLKQSFIRSVDLVAEQGQPESDDGRNLHRSSALDNAYYGGRHYDGTGISMAINDDGFVGPHIDFKGRTNQQAVANDLTGSHGDMTTGIAGGAGNLNPTIRGMAPGAYLFVRAYSPSMSGTLPLHQDSAVLVFSTSYSDGCGGGYTNTTLLVDQEIHQNPTLLQVFSAGNSNNQDCGYGAGTQWGNITGGHKEGKNVIATANLNNQDVVESSSSRGPAVDGRIKPDISAHGRDQMSTDPNNGYAPGGGTSAAAPGIAGVITQLHHAYQSLNGGATAPSALLKATVLNTANDLGNDGPDFIHGWGKINALKAVTLLEDHRYFVDSLSQGDSVTHTIQIPAGVKRAKIMIYWADKEGSTSASFALVNDIDARITDASSTVHMPWLLDHAHNAVSLATPAGRGADHLNNVEQIAIDNPTAGAYTLEVKGTTIPFGQQKYWVVYEYLYEDITLVFPIGGEGLIPGATDRIHWDAYATTGTFNIEYSADGGNTWTNVATANGSARFANWTVPTAITGQGRIRVSRGMVSSQSKVNFSIMARPQNIRVNSVCSNINTIQLAWDSVAGATSYDIFMLGQKYMDSIGSATGLTYDIVVPDVNATYWFSVRARGANGMVSLRQIAIRQAGNTGGQVTCYLSCASDHDAGIDSMIAPATLVERCSGSNSQTVSIQIENLGLFSETNFPVYYQLDNNPVVTETFAGTVVSGGKTTFVFNTSLSLSTGTFTLKTWTRLSNDSTYCNDTLYQTFTVIDPIATFPYLENFENGFPPAQATIINPDAADTWTTKNAVGSNGSTTTAMYIDNYNYNAVGQEDIFRINSLDLSNGNNALLTFDVAYRLYNATSAEELRLDISTDCGQTFSPIYSKVGAALANGSAVAQAWTPTAASDWRTDSIDLSSYIGNNVIIRFVNINAWGQNLYLDNINVNILGLQPIANFETKELSSCDGSIDFADKSGNNPTTWHWDFGDGDTSNLRNPSHIYAANGSYTVSLQVSNSLGNDTETKTNYVTVEYPTIGSTQDGEGCINSSIALTATNGSGSLHWYDGTTLLHVGDTFNTPNLSTTTAYQVQDFIDKPIQKVGPINNTIGGGSYHGSTFTGAVNFTADTSFTILSVWVDANGAGDRVIYLWDGTITNGNGTISNTIVQQITVTLANGPQRVNLNIEVPHSGDFALGGNQMNLYRNNSGASYPYTLPGVLSMTSPTVNSTNFYYYLYDWEIQLESCKSPQQTVTATVIDADYSYSLVNSTASFTDLSTGATSWHWNFGDGDTSSLQNPSHTYTSSGTKTVVLTVNNGACSHSDTLTINVGIEQLDNHINLVVSPNPTAQQTTLYFSQTLTNDLSLELLSIDGRVLQKTTILVGATSYKIDLKDYPSAVYLVKLRTDNKVTIRKIVKKD